MIARIIASKKGRKIVKMIARIIASKIGRKIVKMIARIIASKKGRKIVKMIARIIASVKGRKIVKMIARIIASVKGRKIVKMIARIIASKKVDRIASSSIVTRTTCIPLPSSLVASSRTDLQLIRATKPRRTIMKSFIVTLKSAKQVNSLIKSDLLNLQIMYIIYYIVRLPNSLAVPLSTPAPHRFLGWTLTGSSF